MSFARQLAKKARADMRKPERGPIPIAKTMVDLNTDVDVLARRVGTIEQSAATVGDLDQAGVVTKTADGKIIADPLHVAGPSRLQTFVKEFNS